MTAPRDMLIKIGAAPILVRFFRNVVNDQCSTSFGKASVSDCLGLLRRLPGISHR